MEKVKTLLAAGASLANAIRDALGDRSLAQVALERGVNRSELYSAINGARVATPKILEALQLELGGSVDEWRQVLADALQKRALAV